MLRTLENILGSRLIANDGEIGNVYDFFLEDATWKVRYLVVETGTWLNRRPVLIAPAAFARIDGERNEFRVKLTRDQVESSPAVDTDKPVSRQQEQRTNAHYGWPAYWTPDGLLTFPQPVDDGPAQSEEADGNPHLRSFREISSYAIEHEGEPVAKLADFVIDDTNWAVHQMIVVSGAWLQARPVALPIESILEISWRARTLKIAQSKRDLDDLPTFDPNSPVNRVLQVAYFDYRGKPVIDSELAQRTGGGAR